MVPFPVQSYKTGDRNGYPGSLAVYRTFDRSFRSDLCAKRWLKADVGIPHLPDIEDQDILVEASPGHTISHI